MKNASSLKWGKELFAVCRKWWDAGGGKWAAIVKLKCGIQLNDSCEATWPSLQKYISTPIPLLSKKYNKRILNCSVFGEKR